LSTADGKLSPIVAGCWRMAAWGWTVAQRLAWIEACVDLGVTSFDHADIYGSYGVEILFGEALARKHGLRNRLQLVSKCGIQLVSPQRPNHRLKAYDTSARHIEASVEQSLRALQADHLDLLLIHRPDPLLDADAVAAAFGRLQRSGKVRAFGVSNFTPPAKPGAAGHQSGRVFAAAPAAFARRDVRPGAAVAIAADDLVASGRGARFHRRRSRRATRSDGAVAGGGPPGGRGGDRGLRLAEAPALCPTPHCGVGSDRGAARGRRGAGPPPRRRDLA
jgi:hypothetical protein